MDCQDRKGFTLIELLAVIVILAIIALIATPIIVGVINKAKKNSFMDTAYGVVEAGKLYYAKNFGNDDFTGKTFTFPAAAEDLKLSGEKPGGGTIEVTGTGKQILAIYDKAKNWCASKGENDSKISVVKYEDEKCKIIGNANAPKLTEGMVPIKWDSDNKEIETTKDDPEWYDYSNKKWANVKTKDGSYFVWIPRYAYKITSGYHSSTTGTIDVKFLRGTSDNAVDGTSIKTTGYVAGTNDTSMYYFTHPAFQNDINKEGFWVAKFEPTAVEGVANGYYSDWSCPVAGDNVATKIIKVVPSVNSWRCISISNAYKASTAMKTNATYGWNASSVDTHMATNLEWGAIYYLTLSPYGANKNEVYINNNQNYITGCAGDTASAGASASTTCKNPYDTEIGVKASTTWNITGVYDMSGGSWERTMANYNNLPTNSGFTTEEYNNLSNSHITKYATESANLLNNVGMDYDSKVYGDGVYETSAGANRYNGTAWSGTDRGGWSTEHSYLPYTSGSWFSRGASFYYTSIAGLGSFSNTGGGPSSFYSFRPVVSPLK